MFVLARKMLSLLRGDFLTTAEFIDRAAGSHIAEAFRSSQERLERGIEEDINTAVLEMAKTVAYNESQIRVLIEIMAAFLGDDRASQQLEAKWTESEEPRPDLRDLVVGATSIAPAYVSTTGPLRRLYIQALRGSYVPEIYTFGFGPELLAALIAAQLVPADVAVLEGLERDRARPLSLVSHGPELESYERLARGDFVEMMQDINTGVPAFITHRTQATQSQLKVRRTDKGRRLLTMIKAGRGEE